MILTNSLSRFRGGVFVIFASGKSLICMLHVIMLTGICMSLWCSH